MNADVVILVFKIKGTFRFMIRTSYNSVRYPRSMIATNKRRRIGSAKLCCINCGSAEHILRECTAPTTSFGIVAVRRHAPGVFTGPLIPPPTGDDLCPLHQDFQPDKIPECRSDHGYLFLMVQRKDTMGFIDLVRGRYPGAEPEKGAMLRTYISEMNCTERKKLRTQTFAEIWDNLWRNHSSKSYISEFVECRKKFERLDIPGLLQAIPCQWTEQEYGFPKGRKNIRETDEACALREFCEESGYRRHELRILSREPIEEIFLGTNGLPYRHVYFLAEILRHIGKPRIDLDNLQQAGEVRNVSWFTFEQCMSVIRPYDEAKKELLVRVEAKLKGTCCPPRSDKMTMEP
jgi:8-oxo-dGTP pyrophosphatase MutT (NUDIX family)